MLGNFQAGKDTQERLIIERFLVGQLQGQQFSPEVGHPVISVIHELKSYFLAAKHKKILNYLCTVIRNCKLHWHYFLELYLHGTAKHMAIVH